MESIFKTEKKGDKGGSKEKKEEKDGKKEKKADYIFGQKIVPTPGPGN